MKKTYLLVVLVSSLVAAVGCQSGAMRERAKEEAIKEGIKDLDGTWVLVWEEADGKKVFDAATNANSAETMVLQEGTGSGRSGGEEDCEFTFTIDPTKTPKTLDLLLAKGTGIYKPFEGSNSLAIYELNKDTLKI